MTDISHTIQTRLADASTMLFVTHRSPDADGLGSMVALAQWAKSAGKQATFFVPDKIGDTIKFILGDHPVVTQPSQLDSLAKQASLIVVFDACSESQLEHAMPALRTHREKVVVIDHHTTNDHLSDTQWIDSTAAATGVLIYEVLAEMGYSLSPVARDALATAILLDTGWLRFSNTDGRTMRVMAALLDLGLETDVLYQRLFQQDRVEKLLLLRTLLDGMTLHADGRLAVLSLTKADFEKTGARGDETEGLINEALRVGTIDVVAMFVQQSDTIRASLRSRADVDVAAIAGQFGGGGHARAAGLRSTEPLDTFRQNVVTALLAAMN